MILAQSRVKTRLSAPPVIDSQWWQFIRTKVAVTGALGVGDGGVCALLSGLRQIESLELSKCCQITDRCVETQGPICLHLLLRHKPHHHSRAPFSSDGNRSLQPCL